MKALSPFAIAFVVSGALAGPAFAQAPDSVLAISQAGVSILRVNEDAGLVVRGAANVGDIPATGAGVRMMWYPGRYAFRAGQVSGVQWDAGNIGYGSAAFGTNNIASGNSSFAMGDGANASGFRSFAFSGTATGEGAIAFGSNSEATGIESIGIGVSATSVADGSIVLGPGYADGDFATAIGLQSNASGAFSMALGPQSNASGDFSVAVGSQSSASGDYSLAVGMNASTANMDGAIVFSDASGASVSATAPNQFVALGSGGVIFYTSTDLAQGAQLLPGAGSWSTISDRNRKMNFAGLDGESVLLGLRNVPVTTWNYIAQGESIRHAGAMAQDFYAAFGLGESDRLISTGDMDGITLAAVKALEARSDAQLNRIGELEEQVSTLAADREALLDRLRSLEESQAKLEHLLGAHEADGTER